MSTQARIRARPTKALVCAIFLQMTFISLQAQLAKAQFLYQIDSDVAYVGVVAQLDGDWVFVTCDNSVLKLVQDAKLLFDPAAGCVSVKPSLSETSAQSLLPHAGGVVPTPPPGCGPGGGDNNLETARLALTEGARVVVARASMIRGLQVRGGYLATAGCNTSPPAPICPNCIGFDDVFPTLEDYLSTTYDWKDRFYKSPDNLINSVINAIPGLEARPAAQAFVDYSIRQHITTDFFADSTSAMPSP